MKIIKYLKNYKWWVLLIFCLLIVQAFCELSLPSYTSDIVDVGIQNGGIEYAVPERIRKETLSNLELFMTDEDVAAVQAAYDLSDGGSVLVLRREEDMAALGDILGLPMAMLAKISADGTDIDQIRMALETGGLTKEQLLSRADQAMESMGNLSDSMISSAAISFVRGEYEALGLDPDEIRMDYLWNVGSKMIGLTVLMMAAAFLVSLVGSRVAAAIGLDLRDGIFSRVLSFSSAEINRFSTASLITRSTNDIQQIQFVCVMLLRIVIYAPILGIGGVIKVGATRTGMGWIIGVAIGALLLLVGVLVAVAMPKFKKMQDLIDRLNLVGREILTGLSVIRAFHREEYEEKRFAAANTDLTKTQLFTNRAMAFMMPTMMFIMFGVTIMIEWFGAKGIDMGTLQVGDMIAFTTYTMQIVMAFMMITMVAIFLPRATVAAGRIDEVIHTEPMIADRNENRDGELGDAKGAVSFEDVSFRYPGAENDMLSHISFTAPPGRTTAVIGSTGGGKSTLVNLIPRFYDVTEGRITIDGVDIRDLSQHKLHELIGYVPQKGFLFSGDVESNLKFGGEQISDEAVTEAVRIAQAADFIGEKEEGYKSPISQGGTNVSGGQRQRLSIARAIAKNPKIYIFDDSFSALDYKTDVSLRRALNQKISSATVIIVAQRISTILHADQIIVLNEGKIEGIGTHAELLKTCATYREIAGSQLSAKELGEEE
jgi:ATP-binding cassette subfamily B protein